MVKGPFIILVEFSGIVLGRFTWLSLKGVWNGEIGGHFSNGFFREGSSALSAHLSPFVCFSTRLAISPRVVVLLVSPSSVCCLEWARWPALLSPARAAGCYNRGVIKRTYQRQMSREHAAARCKAEEPHHGSCIYTKPWSCLCLVKQAISCRLTPGQWSQSTWEAYLHLNGKLEK